MFSRCSKCFDKINNGILFSKIIVYWYTTQAFCIKWGSITLSYFNVTNGVWLGGISLSVYPICK